MPVLTASSTAVFNAIGISATSTYGVFTTLIGTALDFVMWLLNVSWPFLLGFAFIMLMWRLASKFLIFK